MKKLVIAGALNVIVTLSVSGAVAWGMYHHMKQNPQHGSAEKAPVKNMEMKDILFIPMSEMLITLHDRDDKDRYLLIEIVFISSEKEKDKNKVISASEPLFQSIAVETLSGMRYEDIHKLHISEIRSILVNALNKGIHARKMEVPYDDLLIKKVIYQ